MELRLAYFTIAVSLITIAALELCPCKTTQKPKDLTENKSILLSAFTQIQDSGKSSALSEQGAIACSLYKALESLHNLIAHLLSNALNLLNSIPGCKPIDGGNVVILFKNIFHFKFLNRSFKIIL